MGVSVNVASYVGATTLRVHEVGYDDRPATADELERMQDLVRQAMREGAMGVGSSLIYAPGNFADTDELIALVSAAAEYDGTYITHMRSEGSRLEEAVQEVIKIASLTSAPAEIYHLKASGQSNWHKLSNVFDMIESARREGALHYCRHVYLPRRQYRAQRDDAVVGPGRRAPGLGGAPPGSGDP